MVSEPRVLGLGFRVDGLSLRGLRAQVLGLRAWVRGFECHEIKTYYSTVYDKLEKYGIIKGI